MISCSRYHDFCAGHRVAGHENKCAHLHGHNYRVHFHVRGNVDTIGRIMDFSVVDRLLCRWLETNWDHKMLLWENDPWVSLAVPSHIGYVPCNSVVRVQFNPTAENMAEYLLKNVGPVQLEGTGVELWRVVVEETRKCWAEATKGE